MTLCRRPSRHRAAIVASAAIASVSLALGCSDGGSDDGSDSVEGSSPAAGMVREATFAVGPDGTSYAAWTREGDNVPRQLEVAVGRGSKLGHPIRIELPNLGVFAPRIATADGTALVAFKTLFGSDARVIVLRMTPDGTAAPPVVVSEHAGDQGSLEVAAANDGSGLIAWIGQPPRIGPYGVERPRADWLYAARIGPGSKPLPAQLVTKNPAFGLPAVAAAPDGRAAIGWAERGGVPTSRDEAGAPMFVMESSPGGRLRARTPLPGGHGKRALGETVALAYTDAGALRGAWVEKAGAGSTAVRTGVTAIRSPRNAAFRHRLELQRNPLPPGWPPTLVPFPGGELVGFNRGLRGGYLPDARRRSHDLTAVSRDRILAHDSLTSRGTNTDSNPLAPRLVSTGSGALAVWGARELIAYSSCSLRGCGKPRDLVTADDDERLSLAGIGAGAFAWLSEREGGAPRDLAPRDLEFKVGAIRR